MKRYSAFAVLRESLRNHLGWDRAWASPEPRARYDVVIVGAGGHGLATAYYLGRNFGITNVAIIEKGWLGGGSQVQIDPEAHTLVWPTGADFDPAMLHDWPEYAGALNKWTRELDGQTA